MSPSRNALILFARDPILGKVKTRLMDTWDAEQVLGLYRCFLQDTLSNLQQVEVEGRFIGVHPAPMSGFFEEAVSNGFVLFEQQGEDLGDRMRQALADRFSEGYEKAVIIGSDSPSLPPGYVQQALEMEQDLVLGPSLDGGYYLIGMKQKVYEVFQDVPWGTSGVLEATQKHIARMGLSMELLSPWYDVDFAEDVHFLKTHLELLKHNGRGVPQRTYDYLTQSLEL